MARWLFLLGGLLIWAAHLAGVYGIASVADLVSEADAPWSRAAIGLLTLVLAAADGAILFWAWRGRGPGVAGEGDAELARFWRAVAGAGAVVSLLGVFWQGLPAIVGR
jgi:hypothetical protein